MKPVFIRNWSSRFSLFWHQCDWQMDKNHRAGPRSRTGIRWKKVDSNIRPQKYSNIHLNVGIAYVVVIISIMSLSLLCPQEYFKMPSLSLYSFYPNVTTLRSGFCCCNSVCRLSVCRLSSVCLSLCNVGAPHSGGWTFRQTFFTAVYAGHPLTSVQNLRRSSQGNLSVGSVKRKRGIKILRF